MYLYMQLRTMKLVRYIISREVKLKKKHTVQLKLNEMVIYDCYGYTSSRLYLLIAPVLTHTQSRWVEEQN